MLKASSNSEESTLINNLRKSVVVSYDRTGESHYDMISALHKSVRGGRMTELLEGKGRSMLAAMDGVAEETGATHAQIALAWLIAQPGVTAPIASATSTAQVRDLLPAMELRLSDDQLARLTDAGF